MIQFDLVQVGYISELLVNFRNLKFLPYQPSYLRTPNKFASEVKFLSPESDFLLEIL